MLWGEHLWGIPLVPVFLQQREVRDGGLLAGCRGWGSTRGARPRALLLLAGKVLEKGRDLKELLSIPDSAVVVAVQPHEPGMWQVKVGWCQVLCVVPSRWDTPKKKKKERTEPLPLSHARGSPDGH